MRVLASRRGFSLVELLTVIAIIAILASIIFPVMGMVNNKARMNKCITQLHQIGLGLQFFKSDNRRYPDILATTVQHQSSAAADQPWAPGGPVIPFDRAGQNPDPNAALGLFPEYCKTARLFHCPNSKEIDAAKVVQDPASGTWFYPYDSYDFMIMSAADIRQHYARGWALTPPAAGAKVVGAIPDDPSGNPPATGDATSDYERQLKFRTPPETTVVTWCSNHEIIGGTAYNGRAPVLFLDGHVDQMQAQAVEDYRYRLLPKRE